MKRKMPKDIDEYLEHRSSEDQRLLRQMRATIGNVAPDAEEKISYGIPTFRYYGGLIGYAAFSKHCSLFPMSMAVIAAFKNELQGFHTSKGTIQFPQDKPLPAALLKKLVKARIAQNEERWRRKKGTA